MLGPARRYGRIVHQRGSTRLRGYNYAAQGAYFVTINTLDRAPTLGEVVNSTMRLSKIGAIVNDCWVAIPRAFPSVSLDVYQLMPNHLHGIIVIWAHLSRDLINQIPTTKINDHEAGSCLEVPTGLSMSRSPAGENWPLMKNSPLTLGKVIRHVKAKATKLIHDAGYCDFAWQGRYHDRIIREKRELDRIRKYILENPKRWSLNCG